MLREDKIRMMTDLAQFEYHCGDKVEDAIRYDKGDYCGHYLLRGLIGYTIGYTLFVVMFLLCFQEVYLGNISISRLAAVLTAALGIYLAGLLVYEIMVLRAALVRYHRAEELMRAWNAKLRYMSRRYDYQERVNKLMREEKQG